MTSLIERIREDQLAARKAGDETAVGLLTALYAETAKVGKDKRNGATTDDEAVAVIRKFSGNAKETLAILKERGDARAEGYEREIKLLAAYMPEQMDEAALESAMRSVAGELELTGPKAMGELMKGVKERFAGRYDGAIASALAKKILAA
jgi:uncharacterized protein YqeY